MGRVLRLIVIALAAIAMFAVPGSASVEPITVPYIAPWQTGFSRMPTMVVNPTQTTSAQLFWDVPQGVWYRVIAFTAEYAAGGTAGDRAIEYDLIQNNQTIYTSGAPGVITAFNIGKVTFQPNQSPYASPVIGGFQFTGAPIADILIQGGTRIELNAIGFKGGDSWQQIASSLMVEIYVQEEGQLVPALQEPTLIG